MRIAGHEFVVVWNRLNYYGPVLTPSSSSAWLQVKPSWLDSSAEAGAWQQEESHEL